MRRPDHPGAHPLTGAPGLHLAHANGFPPACYRRLLAALGGAFGEVSTTAQPGLDALGPPPDTDPWREYADAIGAAVDARGGGLVGVGHSLGAVATLYAAVADPARFSALVLIEPVFLPPWMVAVARRAPSLVPGRRRFLESAARRRDAFASAAEARASYRGKRLFAGIDDEGLDDCVSAMFAADGGDDGGVRLRIPVAWEVRVFSGLPQVWGPLAALPRDLPVIGVRGASSETLRPAAWRRWRRARPDHHLIELPGLGHLAPLEAPARVADAILGAVTARL